MMIQAIPPWLDIPVASTNLLTDAAAFEMLRKVNNQVKAQAPFEPKLKECHFSRA
ncbi:MAG: hypothetical protein PHU25_22270 [Deltaproteobacteria bacterium]|nr:hypothetical protein [Deltaproteobacteria bacterium]